MKLKQYLLMIFSDERNFKLIRALPNWYAFDVNGVLVIGSCNVYNGWFSKEYTIEYTGSYRVLSGNEIGYSEKHPSGLSQKDSKKIFNLMKHKAEQLDKGNSGRAQEKFMDTLLKDSLTWAKNFLES